MDGISDHRLKIENMTRDDICLELNRLVDWSLEIAYYPGKEDHINYYKIRLLCDELELRKSAV